MGMAKDHLYHPDIYPAPQQVGDEDMATLMGREARERILLFLGHPAD